MPLEAGKQRAGKGGETVAVALDRLPLDGIKRLANLIRRARLVIQIADEGADHALEVDVVLPKRIVGVDEQGLAGRKLGHELMVTNGTRRDEAWILSSSSTILGAVGIWHPILGYRPR